ncbi:hypothetical protein BGX33_000593 [Mortierella sp. NVP41]|nr:hypothetical protein BGX33_000593 [Mortierella sp. NVP41]
MRRPLCLASIAALVSATFVQASVIPAPVLMPQSSNPELIKDAHFETLEKCGYGTVAVTFDDGPYRFPNQLLDTLNEHGVKATFFVNGQNIGDIYQYDWVVKRAYKEGHQIAHADLTSLSYDQINAEMTKQLHWCLPVYMRPPYGNLNGVSQDYLSDNGYKIVKWRVDTNDWRHPDDVDESLNAYKSAGGPGFIALEHDTIQSIVNDLVPRVIEYAKSRGWDLVTVGECLGVSPDDWYR